MANSSFLNKVMASSPHIELLIRWFYWTNVGWLSGLVGRKGRISKGDADFDRVSDFLHKVGVTNGDLLLVHSAFGNLKGFGKSPTELIQALKDIVGDDGTIAMPAIRKYENQPDLKNHLRANLSNTEFIYDVYKTKVETGVLPSTMLSLPEAVVSRFPLNSLVAIGPLAAPMMKNNLEGDSPTACGNNSSWKFCVDHGAYIVGLGTDLAGCLTMIHVAEDILDDEWPIRDWYRERKFRIVDGSFEIRKTIRERHPKWGALHWAGRTLCKDLVDHNILFTTYISGVLVEIIRAKDLIDFLNSKNSSGYPYFWVRRHLK